MRNEESGGWKFDKTVNLPTLVTIVSMVVMSTLAYASVKADAARANERVDRVETRQENSDRATAQHLTSIRAEFRADNQIMMNKIDQVIMRLGDTPRNLKEWTK